MKTKNALKAAILLPIAIVALICCAPSKHELAESSLKEVMERNNTVGLAVVAVNNSEIVYQNAFGYRDVENALPLDINNLFRIASISKSFTATGIMQLVEQGKINLDDDVSDLVGFNVRNPHYPDTPITVKMLLSHSSSMSDANGYFSLNYLNPDSSATWQNAWNDYAPGSKYEYCNLGYNTLGTIIERTSGERFDKYIVNNILNPLDLYGGYEVLSLDSTRFAKIYQYNPTDSSFTYSPGAYDTKENEIANYVFGYSTPVFSPTGGMKISPLGLAKIMMMHMNGGTLDSINIINAESSAMMQSPIIHVDSTDTYGFAIETTTKLLDGHTMIGHTGSAYGVYTSMFWDADRRFGFIVMTNGCNGRRDNGFMSIHRECDSILYNTLIK